MSEVSIGIVSSFDSSNHIGVLLKNGGVEKFFHVTNAGNLEIPEDNLALKRQDLRFVRGGRRFYFNRELRMGDELIRVIEEVASLPQPPVELPPPLVVLPSVKVKTAARQGRILQPLTVSEALDLPAGRRFAIARGLFHRRW